MPRLFALVVAVAGCSHAPQDSKQHIERNIERLSSDDPAEREQASFALKRLSDKALPALEGLASGKDAEVAARARSIIKAIHIDRTLTRNLRVVVPDIEGRLNAGDEGEWTRLFLEMLEFGSAKPRDPRVESEDMECLAIRALKGAVSAEDKWRICCAIQNMSLKSALPSVVQLLGDKDQSVRVTASAVLGAMASADVVLRLRELLKSKDTVCREYAVLTLGRCKAAETVPALVDLLSDPESQVRRAVPEVLADLGATAAAPAIEKLLEDGAADVRESALRSLGYLGAMSARQAILLRFNDQKEQPMVRVAALVALGQMSSLPPTPDLMELLDHPDNMLRTVAIAALIRTRPPDAVPGARKLLVDDRPGLRQIGVQVLAGMESRASIDDIAKLLKDQDPEVRYAAALGTCRLGNMAGVPLVLEMNSASAKPDIDVLNAVRNPKTWAALNEKAAPFDVQVEDRDLAGLVREVTGMPVDTRAMVNAHEMLVGGRIGHRMPGRRALAALDRVLQMSPPKRHWHFILEKKNIRIVGEADARAFWKDWWDKLQ